jgi:hypothetical protein
VRQYAAEHGMAPEQAVEAGMAEKSREFGGEIYVTDRSARPERSE